MSDDVEQIMNKSFLTARSLEGFVVFEMNIKDINQNESEPAKILF